MAVKRFYFFGSYSSSPAFRPFIMEVESGNDSVFIIPTTGSGYNYDVKTSNGQTFTGVTGNLTITFPDPNTHYDIEISGDFPRFYFNNGSERLKIKDIKQWGDIVWGVNQTSAFLGCADMTCSALDSPDFTLMTNGASMFRDATSFNPSNFAPTLDNLMNGNTMFFNATSFNPPNFAPTLENLTDGGSMFQGATSFNPPNFSPTLENLTYGNNMFYEATSFNPPNFSPTLENLTSGSGMFYQATNFSQEIYAPNSIYLVSDTTMFFNTKIEKITINNTALTTTNINAFVCPQLTDLILTGRKINLSINQAPLLLGAKIDALFTSLGTANTGATITISTAQNTSGIDTTIATLKGWTIVIV